MTGVTSEYRAAFKAANGYEPTVRRSGDLFTVTTHQGSGELSEADLRKLASALRKLAK